MRRSLHKQKYEDMVSRCIEALQFNSPAYCKAMTLMEQFSPFSARSTGCMAHDNICEHKNKDVKPGAAPTADGQTRNKSFDKHGKYISMSQTLFLRCCICLSVSLCHCLCATVSLCHCLSVSHTHTHTHTLSLSLSLSLCRPRSLLMYALRLSNCYSG